MKRILVILISIQLAGCSIVGVGDYEEAAYTVLLEQDNIQIREYEELLVAQTTTRGTYKESGRSGFQRLGGYIFGDNVANESIAMTAPVTQEQLSTEIAMTVPVFQEQDSGEWIMTFVLPAKYTLETIPKPIDENVIIKTLPSKKIAIIQYSGFLNTESIIKYSELLKVWLDANEYEYADTFYSAAYDPPWTLPFMRRNEVHIEVY